MLKQVLNLGNVKTLSKNEQKEINGGFGDRCGQVCHKHGDCCVVVINSPLGSFKEEGRCYGLQCIPN